MSGSNDQSPYAGAPIANNQNPMAQELLEALTGKGQQAQYDEMGRPIAQPTRIPREAPTPPPPRAELVEKWCGRVKADKKHFESKFKRMRRNGHFANGEQWPERDIVLEGEEDDRYVANIALRHVQQRTAALYASNPTVKATQRERMLAVIWDGDMATLQQAQQQLAQAVQQAQLHAQQTGTAYDPSQPPPGVSPNALAIIADFKNVQDYNKMLKRVAKTLELLWDYNVAEQVFPFKTMMKMTIRRAVITGVGYVKLGFQRAMQLSPEIELRIADMTERLVNIERLSNDIADGEIPPDAPEAEELRLAIQALLEEKQVIVREGLVFDYPDTTAIIPDKKCKSLHGFLGADWVTQEYILSPEEIQEIYNVDVGKSFRGFSKDGQGNAERSSTPDGERPDGELACVWEIYSRKDGLVYVICEGYPDFLREPAAPECYLDRFWPWFPIILNEGYDDKSIFPQSDIDLIWDMQLEINRARQGLREHRHANRPMIAAAGGALDDNDKEKLRTHPANALIELNGLAPGQNIKDVLQPVQMPEIDPAMYDTDATFEDVLRVTGSDQASMGQTSSTTATDVAVAQSSQHTDLASVLDDQDDLLTELATAAGKLLLLNVSAQTVQKVIGPGAVWPELTKMDVVDNLYLKIKAGSTGRPNRQQDMQNAQIIFPMLMRIPNISPEWMARELIRRMDDRMDLTEAFVESTPSMDAINRIQGTVATPQAQDPVNTVNVPPPGAPGSSPTPLPGAPAGGAAPPPTGGAQAPMGGAAPPPTGGAQAPMGGAPNDPAAQGNQGAQNAPAVNPVNGRLGPRTPPVPGANGLQPHQRPGTSSPTP
jgi:hypothetical protein